MTQRDEAERLDFEDGKYTMISDRGKMSSLRYGEPWRDHTGDHLLGCMFSKIQEQAAEIESLRDDLNWVERCANHHGQKPDITAEQALSMIQHYPPIKAITKSYSNGKVPDTHDPYAEIERLTEADAYNTEIIRLGAEKIQRKDALLREALDALERNVQHKYPLETRTAVNLGQAAIASIKTELGEQT